MRYEITHTTKYAYSASVPVCHNLVRLAPRTVDYQECGNTNLAIFPTPIDLSHRIDHFGNRVSYFSIERSHHGLTVTSTSLVRVLKKVPMEPTRAPGWESLCRKLRTDRSIESLDACRFKAPSARIQPVPELRDYALESFTPDRSIVEATSELTSRIHSDFTYDPRATTVQTPVEEVFRKRQGVCQDFAHLQIACIRSLGLAARYVSGYLRTEPPPGKPRLIGADASHAWLSVYCGEEGWIDWDPTNNSLVSTDHVTIAWGRDYDDICPIKGVIVGGGEHRMEVSVDVCPLGE